MFPLYKNKGIPHFVIEEDSGCKYTDISTQPGCKQEHPVSKGKEKQGLSPIFSKN